MRSAIEKQVPMDAERAGKLERLAISQGTTQEALIAKALDLLFLAEPVSAEIPVELRADWDLLQKLDAEAATALADPANVQHAAGMPSRFDLTQGKVVHAIPVPPHQLRRFGADR